MTVSAPQSEHLSCFPTSSVRANSRVLQTRQSNPTCSGTSGAASSCLAAGVLGDCLLVGAGMVNAKVQAAQRARWPTIEVGTARRDPHPGHATTTVPD